jgi:hypothetical protein
MISKDQLLSPHRLTCSLSSRAHSIPKYREETESTLTVQSDSEISYEQRGWKQGQSRFSDNWYLFYIKGRQNLCPYLSKANKRPSGPTCLFDQGNPQPSRQSASTEISTYMFHSMNQTMVKTGASQVRTITSTTT